MRQMKETWLHGDWNNKASGVQGVSDGTSSCERLADVWADSKNYIL